MIHLPRTKDSIALTFVTIVALGLFTAGFCNVLDYLIVKIVLFLGFGALFGVAIYFSSKNETKKNRLEESVQDDSN